VSPEPIASGPALEDEDRARADWYALLAQLYYREPDAGLLASIAKAGAGNSLETGSPFAAAWGALVVASSIADPAAVQQEYDDLFVGAGRADVSPYASNYLAQTGREKILVELRGELANLGLSRKETSREPEDHFAGLFDVMRHLVQRGSTDAALQDQRRFFGRFIEPAYAAFCDAVLASSQVEYFGRVAVLTKTFLDVEKDALNMP